MWRSGARAEPPRTSWPRPFRKEDIVAEREAEQDPELRRLVEAWKAGDDSTDKEDDAHR
jgi:hypothetical protein